MINKWAFLETCISSEMCVVGQFPASISHTSCKYFLALRSEMAIPMESDNPLSSFLAGHGSCIFEFVP